MASLGLKKKEKKRNKNLYSTTSQKSLGFRDWKTFKSTKGNYRITHGLMLHLEDADTQIWEDENFLCGIIEEGNCSKEQYMIFKKSHKTVNPSRGSNLCLR